MAGVSATGTLALIVEDDPATRALEEAVLEADGFAVLTARRESVLRTSGARQ
jgi:DNA-binding response OmpR family regulator